MTEFITNSPHADT